MDQKKQALSKSYTALLIFCVIFIVYLSYTHIRSSIYFNRLLFLSSLANLKQSYQLFCSSFGEFFKYTLALPQGDTTSGGSAFFFVFPLFVFLKIVGGLNVFNIYLYNISISLGSLVLFYFFINKYWGKYEALLASFLWGVSAWFQMFARSATFHGMTIFMAMVWLIVLYQAVHSDKKRNYLWLGIVSFMAMYFYGMVRLLLLVPFLFFLSKKNFNLKKFLFFVVSFVLLLIPAVWLRFKWGGSFINEEHIMFESATYVYRGELFTGRLSFLMYFFDQFLNNLSVFKNLIAVNWEHYSHVHLISFILLLPLLSGVVKLFKEKEEIKNKLLLLITIIIVLLPIFITSNSESQMRRQLLWPLPVFVLIGIGLGRMSKLFLEKKKLYKIVFNFSLWFLILFIAFKEIGFSKKYVWSIPQKSDFADLEKSFKKTNDNLFFDSLLDHEKVLDFYLSKEEITKEEENLIDEASELFSRQTEGLMYRKIERFYVAGEFNVDKHGDFEKATTEGWGSKGEAFELQPTLADIPVLSGRTQEPTNIQGDFWIGSFEKRPNSTYHKSSVQKDNPIGTLTSQGFVIKKPVIIFLLGGGAGYNTRVELLIDKELVCFAVGHNKDRMERVYWDVSPYRGKKARICIVDYYRGVWGHINFDDLQFLNWDEVEGIR